MGDKYVVCVFQGVRIEPVPPPGLGMRESGLTPARATTTAATQTGRAHVTGTRSMTTAKTRDTVSLCVCVCLWLDRL